jgi:hypothetical protein
LNDGSMVVKILDKVDWIELGSREGYIVGKIDCS